MRRYAVMVAGLVASFLAGGVLLSGMSIRAAQEPKTQPKFRGQLYAKWKELGLTDDQKQKIYKVQSEYRAKINELDQKIRHLRREERMKAEEVLTVAQKARLRELLSGDTNPAKDVPAPKDKAKDAPAPKDKAKDK